jgi:hypothetical protein
MASEGGTGRLRSFPLHATSGSAASLRVTNKIKAFSSLPVPLPRSTTNNAFWCVNIINIQKTGALSASLLELA